MVPELDSTPRVASGSTTVVLELDSAPYRRVAWLVVLVPTTPRRVASSTSSQLLVPTTARRVASGTRTG